MKRKTWALAAVTVVAALILAGGLTVTSGAEQPAVATQRSAVKTATVQRRDLSATVSEAGTLGYAEQADGSPYSVINQARGIYTQLPAVGEVISQGHVLYRVNNQPVVLLHGATPAYRTLSLGASGPDVAELNADLVALGYATPSRLRPTSPTFGTATATAVGKLQAALGLAQSGILTLGEAVFEPTAVRVTTVEAQLGASTQPSQPVAQGTSLRRQVQVALSASQQTELAVGDRVSITLPDNRVTPGVVSSMAAVATCPSGADPAGSSSGSSAPGTDTCSSSGATPTIAVGITPSDAAATGRWDQAPVQVGITTARVPYALVVPVTALLAQASGGYAVEVVGATGINHLLAVSLGLFDDADGLVQVRSSGLTAGQRVVAPAT